LVFFEIGIGGGGLKTCRVTPQACSAFQQRNAPRPSLMTIGTDFGNLAYHARQGARARFGRAGHLPKELTADYMT